MFSVKIFIVLLFVMCSNIVQYCHGIIKVVQQSRIIDDGIFFEQTNSFNEGNLVYAICDSNIKNITNCKVVQEKYPYEEAAYSCLVTLENNHMKGNDGLSINVAALGKEKAILHWRYQEDNSTIISIGTVDLKTCEINRVNIPYSNRFLFMELRGINKLVSYNDDSFDVFYNDPKYHMERGGLYKIQIDEYGKMVNEPKSINVERGFYFVALTVATRSPAKGYVYVKRNQMRSKLDFSRYPMLHLLLVKPDGTKKQLANYTHGTVAAGDNFISLCNKLSAKSHIACTQYDENGNVMFTTTLTDSSGNIDTVASHNLSNGGILVMYTVKKCANRQKRLDHFKVVWIGFDGKIKGKLCTQQTEIPKGKYGMPYIYMNEDKEYCVTVIVKNIQSELSTEGEIPVHLTIVANCFTKDDLSI